MPSLSNMFRGLAFITTTLIPLVASHGYIKEIIMKDLNNNDQTYQGFQQDVWNQDTTHVIGWHATNPSNVPAAQASDSTVDFTSPDIICGNGATPASTAAPVPAGSTVTTRWGSGADSSSWPHYRGIVLNYMASCGTTPCSSVTKENLQWFKVDQKRGQPPNNWAILQINQNGEYSFQIPTSIPEGNYVLRQELINLDQQWSDEDVSLTYALDNEKKSHPYYGAQVYPGCINLEVKNPGNTGAVPQGTVATKLYTANDESFKMNVYNQAEVGGYPMPGPPVIQGGTSDVQSSGSQSYSGGNAPQPTGSAGMRFGRRRRAMEEKN
ncbi:MAG: hypothetical protein Q9160_003213 [Pyrenula sp. 1 TL-2023]